MPLNVNIKATQYSLINLEKDVQTYPPWKQQNTHEINSILVSENLHHVHGLQSSIQENADPSKNVYCCTHELTELIVIFPRPTYGQAT